MAYIAYADVDNEISELGQLIPDGKVPLDWVNNKIASAELEINSRLSTKYVTPVSPVPDVLKSISLNMSCYYILRQNYTQEDGNVSSWVENYRKTADDLLNLIMDGSILLDATQATFSTSQDSMQSTTEGLARTFTNGTYDTSGNLISSGTMDGF